MRRDKVVTLLYNMMNDEMPVGKIKGLLRQTRVTTAEKLYVDKYLLDLANNLVDEFLVE